MIKQKEIKEQIVAKKDVKRIRLVLMKNSGGDNPYEMVIAMMEFQPQYHLTKSGNLSSELVKQIAPYKEEAESFRVEDISGRCDYEDGAFERQ